MVVMNNQDIMHHIGLVQNALSGDRQPEEAVKNEVRNILQLCILEMLLTRQNPVVTQQTILGTPGEAGATTRVTELFNIIGPDVVINGLDNLSVQVNNGIRCKSSWYN